mmetsp:Transcript_17948/g.45992  ORF Transcript_17948/g.45992 Transcript_17948/m.45992 type:complete len:907 (-) Transcript_17948:41-2761(-)
MVRRRLRLSRLSAMGLPVSFSEVWVEFELGGSCATSKRVAARGVACWRELEVTARDSPSSSAAVRLVGLRDGRERLLAELTLDSFSDAELDMTIGIGAAGTLTCTLSDLDEAASVAGYEKAVARYGTFGHPDFQLHNVIGGEPILSTYPAVRGERFRPERLSNSALGAALPGAPDAHSPGVESKLTDLFAEFFASEATQTFASLALQHVAVGLRADALISPFAKPKLPRGPRHLPQRWSVSGLMLLGTPQSLPTRRRRSQRQTWHATDESVSHLRSNLFNHNVHAPSLSTPPPPFASSRTWGAEAHESTSFSAMKTELISSHSELRRRVGASSLFEPGLGEDGISTFWLPLPAADERGGGVEVATAELPSGEMLSLEEALLRSAERAAKATAQAQTIDNNRAEEKEENPFGLLALPSNTPDRVRMRRRSSQMVSGGTADELLAKRVRDSFRTRNGREAAGTDVAPLESLDFVRMCGDVLELPHYVGHAIFQEVTGLTGQKSVSEEQLRAFLGDFRCEANERRRVFDALLGPQRPLPGELPGSRAASKGGLGGEGGGALGGEGWERPRAREVSGKRLELVVRGVLALHPGLKFLREHEEFRESYVQTVVARLLFHVGGSAAYGGKSIPWRRWRHFEVVETLFALQDEADINKATQFFSYNDFYVIWCLFWEMDEDEDARLTEADLLRYNNYALSPRAVSRVVSLCGSHAERKEGGEGGREGEISAAESASEQPDSADAPTSAVPLGLSLGFGDFVIFILAEEDKLSHSSMRFWLTVLDLDGDGSLGREDVRYFYEEQHSRMVELGEEPISFAEIFNEMHDMAGAEEEGALTLRELERSGLGVQVIDAIVNIRKLVAWEGLSCQKAAGRATHLRDTRDWDNWVQRHYKRLVDAEEEKEEEEEQKEKKK